MTQILRQTGVVGKFVEYFGHGLAGLPLADRATIANMSPEYGATCGFFPVDDETLRYLRLTGRTEEHVALVEAYCKENGLWHDVDGHQTYSQVVELDLSTVEPSLAGPRRPQDRVPLREAKNAFTASLRSFGVDANNGRLDEAVEESMEGERPARRHRDGARSAIELTLDGETVEIDHGTVVIAAITSCTNTSNPAVMIAAGLLAQKAVERGLSRRPWVKTSLAPGSKVVTEYFEQAGLTPYLEALGFHTVGYGCTTCIGNSGPLPEAVSRAVTEGDLVACAVLSGNRNFEARIHPEVKANYLASPPLVVAYALAGRMDVDLLDGTARARPGGQSGVPLRPLALTRRGAGDDRPGDRPRDVRRHVRERLRRRGRVARAAGTDGRVVRVGRDVDLRPAAAVLRRDGARAARDRRHRARALPRLDRRLRHDRSHLTCGVDQAGLARGTLPPGARDRAQETSTRTARAAATTR